VKLEKPPGTTPRNVVKRLSGEEKLDYEFKVIPVFLHSVNAELPVAACRERGVGRRTVLCQWPV